MSTIVKSRMACRALTIAVASVLVLSLTTGTARAIYVDRPGGSSTWLLVWSDEFSQAAGTQPDTTNKWRIITGPGSAANGELEYYTSSTDNVVEDGQGHLVITALPPRKTQDCTKPDDCVPTSARLQTDGKFSQTYGHIEARMQVPGGQGMWPAFWARNANDDIDYGEIDIMENIGREPGTVYGTLHSGTSNDAPLSYAYTLPDGAKLSDGWHIYAVDWYPDHISFTIDGHGYGTVYKQNAPAAYQDGTAQGWILDHPYYLILNLAVGGNWPGTPDATTWTSPQKLVVDYVRTYAATTPRITATGVTRHAASGMCLNVSGGRQVDGTPVQAYTCNQTIAQVWTAETDGTFRAVGRCLDLTAARQTVINSCDGRASQQWRLESNGDLVNTQSGKCLTDPGSSTIDGIQQAVATCDAGSTAGSDDPAQIWILPGNPTAQWNLADGAGTTATDATGNGYTALCPSGVTWSTDPDRGVVAAFNGAGQSCAASGPVIDATKNFTVSAWVRLPSIPTANVTAVSQDGVQASSFYLQYNASFHAWNFSRMSADSINPTGNTNAYSTSIAVTTSWTHITGTYTAVTRELALYVNGTPAGTATLPATPWTATGPAVVGRAKWNGHEGNFWPGSISQVRLWNRALTTAEVKALYA